MATRKTENNSFLHEFQLEGKGSGKVSIGDWESALDQVSRITDERVIQRYRETDWDALPPVKMAVYCHDCRKIVPPQLEMHRRKMRTVCGLCGSKKVSMGREEALRRFYGLEDTEKEKS